MKIKIGWGRGNYWGGILLVFAKMTGEPWRVGGFGKKSGTWQLSNWGGERTPGSLLKNDLVEKTSLWLKNDVRRRSYENSCT